MNDIDAIARTVWGEARGEGSVGMHAVANVIMNRVNARIWWGLTPLEVCLKPWQFSCWNKNDPNLEKLKSVNENDAKFCIATVLAKAANDGILEDITEGATHYKVVGTHAKWAVGKNPICVIGKHEFYKLSA